MKVTIEHFPMRVCFGEEKALKMIKEAGFDGVDYSFNAISNGQAIDLSNHLDKANKKNLKRDRSFLSACARTFYIEV